MSSRLKAAETDATKRALATFGNPFGLALYDREQAGVRKGVAVARHRLGRTRPVLGCCARRPGLRRKFEKADEFAEALRKAMSEAQDIELLFAIWEQNVETVRALQPAPQTGIRQTLPNS